MYSITTKTGDFGESGLANGERRPKSDLIFEVIGVQDELNSWLGLIVCELEKLLPTIPTERKEKKLLEKQHQLLLIIQDGLFQFGAELMKAPGYKLEPILKSKLEAADAVMQNEMVKNWPTQFRLPGGSTLAAHLDISRTICRRLERRLVELKQEDAVRLDCLKTINRLSDYLYILRCFVNHLLQVKEKLFTGRKK